MHHLLTPVAVYLLKGYNSMIDGCSQPPKAKVLGFHTEIYVSNHKTSIMISVMSKSWIGHSNLIVQTIVWTTRQFIHLCLHYETWESMCDSSFLKKTEMWSWWFLSIIQKILANCKKWVCSRTIVEKTVSSIREFIYTFLSKHELSTISDSSFLRGHCSIK